MTAGLGPVGPDLGVHPRRNRAEQGGRQDHLDAQRVQVRQAQQRLVVDELARGHQPLQHHPVNGAFDGALVDQGLGAGRLQPGHLLVLPGLFQAGGGERHFGCGLVPFFGGNGLALKQFRYAAVLTFGVGEPGLLGSDLAFHRGRGLGPFERGLLHR